LLRIYLALVSTDNLNGNKMAKFNIAIVVASNRRDSITQARACLAQAGGWKTGS
jgi:hypothetical protein